MNRSNSKGPEASRGIATKGSVPPLTDSFFDKLKKDPSAMNFELLTQALRNVRKIRNINLVVSAVSKMMAMAETQPGKDNVLNALKNVLPKLDSAAVRAGASGSIGFTELAADLVSHNDQDVRRVAVDSIGSVATERQTREYFFAKLISKGTENAATLVCLNGFQAKLNIERWEEVQNTWLPEFKRYCQAWFLPSSGSMPGSLYSLAAGSGKLDSIFRSAFIDILKEELDASGVNGDKGSKDKQVRHHRALHLFSQLLKSLELIEPQVAIGLPTIAADILLDPDKSQPPSVNRREILNSLGNGVRYLYAEHALTEARRSSSSTPLLQEGIGQILRVAKHSKDRDLVDDARRFAELIVADREANLASVRAVITAASSPREEIN